MLFFFFSRLMWAPRFDHNWGFSIPTPQLQPLGGWSVSQTGADWLGLDNCAWGSHIYYESVRHFHQATDPTARTLSLTKFAPPDWVPGFPSTWHQESPGQHRYPVWWTGDGVSLQGSVESMVDTGLFDLKPYVHSDCGADWRGSDGDFMRWVAHCTFGTILRIHGADHRPWTYASHTVDVVRNYLNLRYQLLPSLIAGGQSAVFTGFPIVARGDFFWPEHPEASSNDQYIHLNDTLVAPIWDSMLNGSTRSVWVPPGQWQDQWSGDVVSGPGFVSTTQPWERIPLWTRRGALLVMAPRGLQRVRLTLSNIIITYCIPAFYLLFF